MSPNVQTILGAQSSLIVFGSAYRALLACRSAQFAKSASATETCLVHTVRWAAFFSIGCQYQSTCTIHVLCLRDGIKGSLAFRSWLYYKIQGLHREDLYLSESLLIQFHVLTFSYILSYRMDTSDQSTTKSVTALEEEEPSSSQFARNRGRSNSPPWRKLLVYDCEQQTVKVKSEKNIG